MLEVNISSLYLIFMYYFAVFACTISPVCNGSLGSFCHGQKATTGFGTKRMSQSDYPISERKYSMKHYRYFLLLLAYLTIVVFSYTLVTPNAHASAQSIPSPVNNGCTVQNVHLNGNQPPTITCLTLDTVGSDCSSSTLSLRATDGFNMDYYLCFLGTGFVNLTDYPWGIGSNWDNRANWYGTGCNTGTFFADSNGSGTKQTFSPGVQANFDGQNGRLPFATLSSLQITSSC